jgi:prepilin-type N-terminal cleavage/methylation domain-containing protein
MNTRKQKGFSLIELLVVVAIMLVIAAVAIPAAVASRQSGNEGSAATNLKTMVTAENAYAQLYGAGYSSLAKNLDMSAAGCPNTPTPGTNPATNSIVGACLLANNVADNADAGTVPVSSYLMTYTGNASGFTVTAVPTGSLAGRKSFCADGSGSIVYAWSLTITPATPGTTCGTAFTPLGS